MDGKLIVFSNAADGRDDEFNEWYNDIHLDEVLALGPFTTAQRFEIGGAQMFPQSHRYLAIYEFEGDPQGAADALMNGAATLNMSDALADPMVVIVEPITEVYTR